MATLIPERVLEWPLQIGKGFEPSLCEVAVIYTMQPYLQYGISLRAVWLEAGARINMGWHWMQFYHHFDLHIRAALMA